MLLHSAKGFYDVGFNCAYNLNKDQGISVFQRISAGAVNMSFAAELFLKAIHLIISKKPIMGHKLLFLYNDLPENVKHKIEEQYKFQLKNNKEIELLPSFKMNVFRPNEKPTNEQPDDARDELYTFLEKHNHTFEHWRYLHEIKDGGYAYDINFKTMDCFIKSLIDFINNSSAKPDLFLNKAK